MYKNKTIAYTLTDLVSLDRLQKIQDSFALASQVASTITDLEGNLITQPSNHSDVCKMVRATEKGAQKCRLSAENLGAIAAETMKPYHKKCLSCGFTDAAAPIIVGGRHLANWLIGQYYIRDVDEKGIRQFAREIEADEERMAEALEQMPKISKDKFEKVLNFLWLMANEISTMGYQNLMQRRQTEELQRVRKQLEKHKGELEIKVAERTAALVKLNSKLSEEINLKDRVQREQNRLITAIEHAAESIVITDEKATIVYVNPAFEQITGYSSAEVLGKKPDIFKSGVHDRAFYQDFWETISQGKIWSGCFRNRSKEGTVYSEETTVSSIRNGEGRIINYVAVKRDITKELEMERKLQQVSKLESIGTLAAGIAHEINTPIQYVRDNTKFLEEAFQDLNTLEEQYGLLINRVRGNQLFSEEVIKIDNFAEEIDLAFLKEEMQRAIGGALEGLDRISTIVKAMKEFSHPGTTEKQPEDVNGLIESTLTVSRSEWKHSADVVTNFDEHLPQVPVISGEFKQVILNLVVNAAHAISQSLGGGDEKKGEIGITTCYDDSHAYIVVCDNGIGIPDENLDKIFDPFFTTKDVGEGTGQGLSMVHSTMVDGHGGSVSVTSTMGEGAEFTLSLPLESGSN